MRIYKDLETFNRFDPGARAAAREAEMAAAAAAEEARRMDEITREPCDAATEVLIEELMAPVIAQVQQEVLVKKVADFNKAQKEKHELMQEKAAAEAEKTRLREADAKARADAKAKEKKEKEKEKKAEVEAAKKAAADMRAGRI